MEYVHSALLLHAADQDVNEENVTNVLEAAGVEVDSARVKSLVAALEDVDIEDAMNTAVAGGAAAAPADAGGSDDAASEESADEGESEADDSPSEEEAEADEDAAEEGLGGLF